MFKELGVVERCPRMQDKNVSPPIRREQQFLVIPLHPIPKIKTLVFAKGLLLSSLGTDLTHMHLVYLPGAASSRENMLLWTRLWQRSSVREDRLW